MQRIVPIESVQQVGMLSDGLVAALPAEDFASHRPDVHLALLESGVLAGRLSLWCTRGPKLKAEGEAKGEAEVEVEVRPVAAIGHYAASSDPVAMLLLERACQIAAEKGHRRVVGPIDGSLWRRHRFITARGDHPPFFLEPDNPDAYPLQFQQAGFSVMLRSCSTIVEQEDLSETAQPEPSLLRRLGRHRLDIRAIDLSRFEQELAAIHALVSRHFDEHPLYSPMSRQAFVHRHLRSRSIILPDLTLLAEVDGKLVGFIFAVPDLLQERRGQEIDTLVVRTLASAPERRYAGLGRLLLGTVHQRAAQRGFRRVIHALLPESSHWESLGRRSARVIRQYAMFCRELT